MVKKITKEWVSNKLPKRPKDANKGTFGKVLAIAGSQNYPGAAYLACAASYRVGAGLVTLATTKDVQQIIGKKLPEVTFIILPQEISFKEYDVCLIGPGLSQSDNAVRLTRQLLNTDLPPTVLDGDGLNIFSKTGKWWEGLGGSAVLTPHPGEMARLTGLTADQIQSDRVNITQQFAKFWNQLVVLKGANTVIASPCGEVAISPFVNPALATAGTGDVLSGMITGLVAQGLNSFDAACVGCYIHGLAGEILRERIGDAGGLANDLLPIIPIAIKSLKKF